MLKKLNPGDAQLRAAILEKLMGQLDGHDHDMRKSKVAAMAHGGMTEVPYPEKKERPAPEMPHMMARGGDVGQETPLPPGELVTDKAPDMHQEMPKEKMPKMMADGGEVDPEAEDSLKGDTSESMGNGDTSLGEVTKADGDPSDESMKDEEPSPEEMKRKLRMML